MEFEIKRKIDFDVEELASTILDVADSHLYDKESGYDELDDKQKDILLMAIFGKALEILESCEN